MQGMGNTDLNKFNEDELVLEKHEAKRPNQGKPVFVGQHEKIPDAERVLQLLIELLEEQEQVKIDYELL